MSPHTNQLSEAQADRKSALKALARGAAHLEDANATIHSLESTNETLTNALKRREGQLDKSLEQTEQALKEVTDLRNQLRKAKL